MIVFSCPCGKKMQVKDELAGRQVKCPACQNAVTIPQQEVEVDVEAEEEWESAAPRKRGSSPLFWLLSSLFLMCLCGVGSSVGWFGTMAVMMVTGASPGTSPGSATAEKTILGMVPADAAGFMSIRAADVWQNRVVQEFRNQPRNKTDKFVKDMKKNMGLQPEDLELVVLVMPRFPTPEETKQKDGTKNIPMWAIMQATNPYDKEKILKESGKATEKTHNGKTYYHVKMTQGETDFYFLGPRRLVAGNEPGVIHFLDQQAKTQTNGPLASAIQLAKSKHFVLAAQMPGDWRQEMRKKLLQLGPYSKQAAPFVEVESGYLTVHETGSEVEVQVSLTFPDDSKASEAQTMLAQLKTQGQTALAQMANAPAAGGPGGPPTQLLNSAMKTLAKTVIQQQGRELTVSTQVESSALQSLPNMMGPAMGFR